MPAAWHSSPDPLGSYSTQAPHHLTVQDNRCISVAAVASWQEYIATKLQPTLVKALTVLAREKPTSNKLDAITFLANWMLEHNPNKPQLQVPAELQQQLDQRQAQVATAAAEAAAAAAARQADTSKGQSVASSSRPIAEVRHQLTCVAAIRSTQCAVWWSWLILQNGACCWTSECNGLFCNASRCTMPLHCMLLVTVTHSRMLLLTLSVNAE